MNVPVPAASPDSPFGALLRGTLLPVAVVGGLAVAVSARDSPAAAVGALIGAGLAAAAFSVGPVIMNLARTWSPPAVMAVALTGYAVLVGVLAMVYLILERAAWLSHVHLGWSLFACALAAIAGQVRAVARLRVLAFGAPRVTEATRTQAETPGQPASAPAPHTRGD